jgi:SnoaL-like protein
MTLGILGTIVLVAAVAQDATIPAAARLAIAETNAAWLEAMKRQDAAAIAAIYGDEAVFIQVAAGELFATSLCHESTCIRGCSLTK